MNTDPLGRIRLLQLASPSLPVGGFSYSQGLERAVEAGWVHDVESFIDWVDGLVDDTLAHLDLPVLYRMIDACREKDLETLEHWSTFLLAHRETSELRNEERTRATAMTTLLCSLEVPQAKEWTSTLGQCQVAPWALAATHFDIAAEDTLLGYAWNWLENQVAAAIKLVPLGQTDGQRIQLRSGERLPDAAASAMRLDDDELGSGAFALAIASSQHETQYTRLFRS